MIRYFAEHPNAANILMIVIIMLGFAALPSLNKETFPEIKNRHVQVTIPYPGASPFEVEEGICNPLEDATDGLSYLEEQKCVAKEGLAVFTLEMKEVGDMASFNDDVKSAVEGIITFPDNAEDPIIERLGRTQAVVSVAVTAKITRKELKALAEYYRAELLKIPQVPIVNIEGFATHELRVKIKPETLSQYQLSIEDIANLIRQQSLDMPAGTIKSSNKDYQIRFENSRKTVEELTNLIITYSDLGGQIRLGDIATIEDRFENEELKTEINGFPAAILNINKNTTDDSLIIFEAVKNYVENENHRLPESTRLILTKDSASIVKDRLRLLLKNGWQGLLLAACALILFFSWRYTLWVTVGLPVSFIGGLLVMSTLGITINMISMVALLMAIGILMDDAIVLSESIASEFKKNGSPIEAVVSGANRVKQGVFSSFATSAMLFGSLLFLQGDMGQIMKVLPIVLLSVLSISLLEAFLILPHHLKHALKHEKKAGTPNWRLQFEKHFERLRQRVGRVADWSIRFRYFVVGTALSLFILSISLIPSGILKFKFFPDLEGNVLEARVLLPQGTPFNNTKKIIDELLASLQKTLENLPEEKNGELVKNIQIAFSKNADAGEDGAHLATITLDLLNAESRTNSLNTLRSQWQQNFKKSPEAISIQFKEPSVGPAGQAIAIRLQGDDLDELSEASWRLQNWLSVYNGVSNIADDLRPGKPQFSVSLLPGALNSGVDAHSVASQLRAAYQGVKVSDIYQGREAYEINVILEENPRTALSDLQSLTIFNQQKQDIPLSSIAKIEEKREFSKVTRINHIRTIEITGDIDNNIANTTEVLADTKEKFLSQLERDYPHIHISLEGEVKNSRETNSSIFVGFFLGIAGVYFLLCLQFKNYSEPLIVLINIPLALIGVIWGHLIMGLDLTMPSMIGFVSLAGIVVNDSILLVEFVKLRSREGMSLHEAAGQATRDRFRAIFLTSITTVAGMLPLLSETSLQAQILVPLVASVVFGIMSSTLLILLVLPSAYAILEDLKFREKHVS